MYLCMYMQFPQWPEEAIRCSGTEVPEAERMLGLNPGPLEQPGLLITKSSSPRNPYFNNFETRVAVPSE